MFVVLCINVQSLKPTHRSKHQSSLMERRFHFGHPRHGFCRATGVDQDHFGAVVDGRPLPFTGIVKRQDVAGGDGEGAREAEFVGVTIQLGIKAGFFQHAASAKR